MPPKKKNAAGWRILEETPADDDRSTTTRVVRGTWNLAAAFLSGNLCSPVV
jgi:hypothetical protein